MEKVGALLWVLFAIGAFVFRMVKKMQETTAKESRERPTRPGNVAPSLPTATFQDMLKQMQARNAAPAPADTPPAAPYVPAPVPAAPERPRTLGGRLMPREIARPARSQERPARVRPSLEAPATALPRNVPAPPARRSAAKPRASAEAPITDYWQTEPAARAASPGDAVRQMLRQPDSLRTAFILSEIFRRPD